MEYDTILRELKKIEERVAQTQKQILMHRERIKSMEACGRRADFAAVLLRECELALASHLSAHEKLLKQLLRTSE
jgi:hypothetical protein